MLDISSEKKIAVLIDAENTPYSILDFALKEISKHGHLLAKRAYGDWSTDQLKNWKSPLNELAITPVQQFSYTQGKNSSDAAMIIDAMDLLYSGKFDAFALISSDSDFTKLASRLKESEIYVFGVGKRSTPIAFRNACDDFMYTEVLKEQNSDADEVNESSNEAAKEKIKSKVNSKDNSPISIRNQLRMNTKLVKILREAVSEYADAKGWAHLAVCGSLIKRQYPDFSPKNYGFANLTNLIEETDLFDIQRRRGGGVSAFHIYVKDNRK